MAPESRRRVVLIGPDAARLLALLEGSSAAPELHILADLYGSIGALVRLQPDAVWIDIEPLAEEDLGALRLVRSLLPATRMVLTAPAAQAERADRLARVLGADVVRRPFRADQVLATLLNQPDGGGAEDTTALVIRGLSDEIGNPLLFAAGYLQLLILAIDRRTQPELLEKIELVRGGMERIDRSLVRLRKLTEPQRPVLRQVEIRALALAAFDRVRPRALSRGVRLPAGDRVELASLQIDAERTATSLELVLGWAVELATPDTQIEVAGRNEGPPAGYRLQLSCETARAAELPLARGFEPYAFAAQLRGTEVGLNLALARVLLGAQGATARLTAAGDTTVRIEICWPSRPAAE
jgi:hypothetical protein